MIAMEFDYEKSFSAANTKSITSNRENIKVLVRVRPRNDAEIDDTDAVNLLSEKLLSITNSDGKKSFQCSYDYILGPDSQQVEVYGIIRECTTSVLNGFNSTVLAYGQTSSGKTYSMYGPPSHDTFKSIRSKPQDEQLIGDDMSRI